MDERRVCVPKKRKKNLMDNGNWNSAAWGFKPPAQLTQRGDPWKNMKQSFNLNWDSNSIESKQNVDTIKQEKVQ